MPTKTNNAQKPEPLPASPADPSPPASQQMGQNDLFRDLTFVWIAVNLIDARPRRVRKALKRQEAAVFRAIKRFGFRIPILVQQVPGGERYEVLDGHARLAAARLLDAENLPCILVDDLPDTEIRRLALSLNRLQERGEWDQDALHIEINELIELTSDLEFPGFEPPEIDAICFGAGDDADPVDDIDSIDAEGPAVSRPGDYWILGAHQIWCGSAREGGAILDLLGDRFVDAVFTDPPYDTKISGNVRSAKAGFNEFAEASGEMPREDFVAFLVETLGNARDALRPGGVIFACIDWRHIAEMTQAFKALDLEMLNICDWVKANAGMGGVYRSQHEFVFVARKPGAKHMNNVQLGVFGRNRSNVWHYAGATGGAIDPDDDHTVHPTAKPIRMVMDALLDVTASGELVFDPFLGSGTTLLAAERTRRRCLGIEIDPRYVDVAIRRWQEMTGAEAIHKATGETFDAIEQVRASGDASGSEMRRERVSDAGAYDEGDF